MRKNQFTKTQTIAILFEADKRSIAWRQRFGSGNEQCIEGWPNLADYNKTVVFVNAAFTAIRIKTL